MDSQHLCQKMSGLVVVNAERANAVVGERRFTTLSRVTDEGTASIHSVSRDLRRVVL